MVRDSALQTQSIIMPSLTTTPPSVPARSTVSTRIKLPRAQRKIFISLHREQARSLTRFVLTLGDALALGGMATLFPLAMPAAPAGTIATIFAYLLPPLLLTYVAGGYRVESVLRAVSLKWVMLAALGGATAGRLALVGLTHHMLEVPVPNALHLIVCALVFTAWVGATRRLVRIFLRRAEQRAKIVFLGPPTQAAWLEEQLRQHGSTSPFLHIDTAILFEEAEAKERDDSEEPSVEDTLDTHIGQSVKSIVLGVPFETLPSRCVADLVHARLRNIPVQTQAQLVEELMERTPITIGDRSWFLNEDKVHAANSPVYLGFKRLTDILVAGILFVICLPVMIITAILVRATSRGPSLFTQVRVGLWKETFTIYKFRTMYTDAEKNGAQWAQKNDPRVTPIGAFLRKSRLDELPQLWNVLTGDMSLVGPRPERPEFNAMLEEQVPYYDLRHLVKPGLTGWAQVCYPYGAGVKDAIAKLEYEIFYIKNAGTWFDLRVLMRTVAVVCGLRGR